VQPVAGAREAQGRLRAAGILLAVVSNQSGVARGLLTPEQVLAVNARVDELLGPLGPFLACLHGEDDGCTCRKPAPGLVLQAADRLGVPPERCVVIGDTAADVGAAESAGARGILVPNRATRREEIEAATEVAPDLASAVDLVLASTAAASRVTASMAAAPTAGLAP
jgi:histidinol-phosphate phosphatase family protein